MEPSGSKFTKCTSINKNQNILEETIFGPGPLCLLGPYVCEALGPCVCPLGPWARQVHFHFYIAARSMLHGSSQRPLVKFNLNPPLAESARGGLLVEFALPPFVAMTWHAMARGHPGHSEFPNVWTQKKQLRNGSI